MTEEIKPRKKPVYGRYRINGPAKQALAWTRQGETIHYDTEEQGNVLVLVCRSKHKDVALRVEVEMVAREDAAVRCILRPFEQEALVRESMLDHRAMYYATMLAMAWDWVAVIETEMPTYLGAQVHKMVGKRKHIARSGGRTILDDDRVRYRYHVIP